jgi:hypothetical protein
VSSGLVYIAGFAHIARLLNDPEADSYDETLKQTEETFRRKTVRFYINAFFSFGVWAVAV